MTSSLFLILLLAQAPGPKAASTEKDEPAPGMTQDEPGPKVKLKQPPKPPPDEEGPIDVPEKGDNERLIDDIAATTGNVSLPEVVDEIMGDVVAELAARSPKRLSPLAIRNIRLGANVQPNYARVLANTIVANIQAGTSLKIMECLECQAVRSRMVGDQWVVQRGIVDSDDMKRIGQKLGVKAFMDVAFGFEPESGIVQMDFSVVEADDGMVIWADSFRADRTTPMLLRSSFEPQKKKERLKDLEMLLEGRPFYGYVVNFGYMLLPYDDPMFGDIGGATVGFRVYERFGVDRRVLFGLDGAGFINTSRLAGGVISAGAWWVLLRPDFINPELRLGGKVGAFVAGSEGNAAMFQLGAEVLLRYRFGLFGYLLIMTKSQFDMHNLGGLGFSGGMSVNW
jgi:hypothetical protein